MIRPVGDRMQKANMQIAAEPTAIPPVETISIPPVRAPEIKVPHITADSEHAVGRRRRQAEA